MKGDHGSNMPVKKTFVLFPSDKQTGQVLVIFVFSLIALMAFLALVLDGGMLMLRRREAQVAADAGSLAGAIPLCGSSPDTIEAEARAQEYASIQNSASAAAVTFPSPARISVNPRRSTRATGRRPSRTRAGLPSRPRRTRRIGIPPTARAGAPRRPTAWTTRSRGCTAGTR